MSSIKTGIAASLFAVALSFSFAQAAPSVSAADDHGAKMTVAQVAARPGLGTIPAVRDGHVALVSAGLVSRPAPRVADGVLAVASVVFPERFKK